MKITFLGTSHGVPSAERYCSGTLLEINGTFYLIDAGAPVIDLLLRRGVDLDKVKAAFTTHLHNDHTDGLLSLAALFTWHYKTTDIDIYLTEQRGIDAYRELLRATIGDTDDKRVRFKLMTPETVWQDENIRVTPMPTRHMASSNRPAYSYLVEAEGRKVLFSGDLSFHLTENDFPACALENDLDLMVCEMAHFDIEHVQPYLEKCRAKRVLFNHVYPVTKLPLIDALDGRFGYPIKTVADGDVFEL